MLALCLLLSTALPAHAPDSRQDLNDFRSPGRVFQHTITVVGSSTSMFVTVVDDTDGMPLPGATVDLGLGGLTSPDGTIAIAWPSSEGYGLQASFPGYETAVRPVTAAELTSGLKVTLRLKRPLSRTSPP